MIILILLFNKKKHKTYFSNMNKHDVHTSRCEPTSHSFITQITMVPMYMMISFVQYFFAGFIVGECTGLYRMEVCG